MQQLGPRKSKSWLRRRLRRRRQCCASLTLSAEPPPAAHLPTPRLPFAKFAARSFFQKQRFVLFNLPEIGCRWLNSNPLAAVRSHKRAGPCSIEGGSASSALQEQEVKTMRWTTIRLYYIQKIFESAISSLKHVYVNACVRFRSNHNSEKFCCWRRNER